MIKSNALKILFALILPATFLVTYFSFENENAQAQALCDVSSPAWRTTKPSGLPFFIDSERPFVYIDIDTQNCMGQILQFTLLDNLGGGPIAAYGAIGVAYRVDALDERPIAVGANTGGQEDFTIVMRAGEENCSVSAGPDCQFFLAIGNDAWDPEYRNFSNLFMYQCEGSSLNPVSCADGDDWSYHGIKPYGTDHQLDPYGTNFAGAVVPPPDSGFDDDPTDSPDVIDLHLTNPLTGTIDTIPTLFQKIIDIIIKIGIPLVAMAIMYAGFLFVVSRGSSEGIQKAKDAFIFAVIGGLVLLASWLIAEAIRDALTELAYVF